MDMRSYGLSSGLVTYKVRPNRVGAYRARRQQEQDFLRTAEAKAALSQFIASSQADTNSMEGWYRHVPCLVCGADRYEFCETVNGKRAPAHSMRQQSRYTEAKRQFVSRWRNGL